MASITMQACGETHPNLRPLNVLRDLPGVADLVELCFSSTMDSDGRNYVRQMRDASRDNYFLSWANKVSETASLPLSGFVWEENGKIVGNASLLPFRYRKQKIYLIANVATHPDYRRRGIGRALTERSMQNARQKKADSIWLHVRDDNPGAVKLYLDLGFIERARRTTWQAHTDPLLPVPEAGFSITARHPHFWPQQREWLQRLHPDELSWHHNWNWKSLEPGLRNWLYRLFVEVEARQWAALKNGTLQAVLSWMPISGRFADPLWMATNPNGDETALKVLLLTARRELSYRHYLSLEYPAENAAEAIRSAGFSAQRTLIWMQAPGATS